MTCAEGEVDGPKVLGELDEDPGGLTADDFVLDWTTPALEDEMVDVNAWDIDDETKAEVELESRPVDGVGVLDIIPEAELLICELLRPRDDA